MGRKSNKKRSVVGDADCAGHPYAKFPSPQKQAAKKRKAKAARETEEGEISIIDLCDEDEPCDAGEPSIITLDESTTASAERIIEIDERVDGGDGGRENSANVNLDEEDSFFMDTSRCDETGNIAFLTDENISEIKGVVSHEKAENADAEKGGAAKRAARRGCFNCMGNHSIAACPEPRDQRRIEQNREKFGGNRYAGNNRLHSTSAKSANQEDFRPGVLSKTLRHALGIGASDLPEWIFRMRKRGFVHGYPPAYLKRAVEKNILSFVTDDKPDESITLDKSKLYLYPGFNSELRAKNDTERFKVPEWKDFVRMHEAELEKRKACELETKSLQQKKRNLSSVSLPAAETTTTNKKRKNDANSDDASPSSSEKRARKTPAATTNYALEEGEIIDSTFGDDLLVAIVDGDDDGNDKADENGGMNEERNNTDDGNETQDVVSMTSLLTTSDLRDSAAVVRGTPILMSRDITDEHFNHEVPKPSLDNFAKALSRAVTWLMVNFAGGLYNEPL